MVSASSILALGGFSASALASVKTGVFKSIDHISPPKDGFPETPSWSATVGWSISQEMSVKEGDTFALHMPFVYKFTAGSSSLELVAGSTVFAKCALFSGDNVVAFSELQCVATAAVEKVSSVSGTVEFPFTFNAGMSSDSVNLNAASIWKAGTNKVVWSDGAEFSCDVDFFSGSPHGFGRAEDGAFFLRKAVMLNTNQHYVLGPQCYCDGMAGYIDIQNPDHGVELDCKSVAGAISEHINEFWFPESAETCSVHVDYCSATGARVSFKDIPTGFRPYINVNAAIPKGDFESANVYSYKFFCGDDIFERSKYTNWYMYKDGETGGDGDYKDIVVTTVTGSTGCKTEVGTETGVSTNTIVVTVPPKESGTETATTWEHTASGFESDSFIHHTDDGHHWTGDHSWDHDHHWTHGHSWDHDHHWTHGHSWEDTDCLTETGHDHSDHTVPWPTESTEFDTDCSTSTGRTDWSFETDCSTEETHTWGHHSETWPTETGHSWTTDCDTETPTTWTPPHSKPGTDSESLTTGTDSETTSVKTGFSSYTHSGNHSESWFASSSSWFSSSKYITESSNETPKETPTGGISTVIQSSFTTATETIVCHNCPTVTSTWTESTTDTTTECSGDTTTVIVQIPTPATTITKVTVGTVTFTTTEPCESGTQTVVVGIPSGHESESTGDKTSESSTGISTVTTSGSEKSHSGETSDETTGRETSTGTSSTETSDHTSTGVTTGETTEETTTHETHTDEVSTTAVTTGETGKTTEETTGKTTEETTGATTDATSSQSTGHTTTDATSDATSSQSTGHATTGKATTSQSTDEATTDEATTDQSTTSQSTGQATTDNATTDNATTGQGSTSTGHATTEEFTTGHPTTGESTGKSTASGKTHGEPSTSTKSTESEGHSQGPWTKHPETSTDHSEAPSPSGSSVATGSETIGFHSKHSTTNPHTHAIDDHNTDGHNTAGNDHSAGNGHNSAANDHTSAVVQYPSVSVSHPSIPSEHPSETPVQASTKYPETSNIDSPNETPDASTEESNTSEHQNTHETQSSPEATTYENRTKTSTLDASSVKPSESGSKPTVETQSSQLTHPTSVAAISASSPATASPSINTYEGAAASSSWGLLAVLPLIHFLI